MTNIELNTLIAMLFAKKEPFEEYLKVTEYLKGQKFLESYTTQSVYTSVYWVHEVNGNIVETYLSTSELASWECETLEPYYYTDNNRQYVGYYQLPPNEKFGEHTMKISYKSPDTGNILEIEYPIYYFEEKSFALDISSYDWYPFRTPLELTALGTGTLNFECTKKNGDILTEEYTYPITGTEMNLTINTVVNGAEYQFGDNQELNVEYISIYTHKVWTNVINLNIRPYNDERNPEKLGDYDIKDLEFFEITYSRGRNTNDCITNANTYSGDFSSFSVKINDDNTQYYYTYPNSEELVGNFQEALTYSKTESLVESGLTGTFKPPFIFSEFGLGKTFTKGTSTGSYNTDATFGFIYWGDGTFDKYVPAIEYRTHTNLNDNIFFQLPTNQSISGSANSYYSCYYLNLLKPCGYTLNGNSRVKNRTQKMFKELEHQYFDTQEYKIIITSSFQGTSTRYNIKNNMQSSTGQGVYDFELGKIDYKKWEWYGDSRHIMGGLYNDKPATFTDEQLISNRLAYDDMSYCIKGVSVGDGCLLDEHGGYDYTSNKFTTSVELPAEGFNHLGLCLHDLGNLSYLRLPKYSGSYLGGSSYSGTGGYGVSNYSNMSNYDNLMSLKEIHFGGTIGMWNTAWLEPNQKKYCIDAYRQVSAVHDVPFLLNVGNNYAYRNYVDYILTIHCTDGDIRISLNDDCLLTY